MAGPAAGDDAGSNGNCESAHGEGSKMVKVRDGCGLQLGLAGVGVGEAAEAVDYKKDDLGVGNPGDLGYQLKASVNVSH